MFHVPYTTMATIHAKRSVADTNVRMAARALVAEMRLSELRQRSLENCEQKSRTLSRLNTDLMDENWALREANGDGAKKIASLRPWATIGKVLIYGGVATGVFLLINETTSLIP